MAETPNTSEQAAAGSATATRPDDASRKTRRIEYGVVTSAHKTPKTLRVDVLFQIQHPQYNKYIRRRQVLHVHDEKEEANEGDRVQVMACRPISKQKNWRLLKIIEKAPQD